MVARHSHLQALHQRISSLSSAQQQLLRQQLEAQGVNWHEVMGAVAGSEVDKPTRPERLPLSAAQMHLWVLHQLYPATTAYHIAMALQLVGDLDVVALSRSVQDIINRHESLRTVVVEQDHQVYQTVQPELAVDLVTVDLRQVSDPRQRVAQWRRRLAHEPFDLAIGPLVRVQLLQLQQQSFELILVLHHLIADGWSRGLLLQELAAFYRGYVTGAPVQLPPLSLQYPDIVLLQQQEAQGEAYQHHLAYWNKQLAGLTPLSLPCDDPTSTDFSSRTLTQSFTVAQTQAIKALGQQWGASLFMVLLALFKLLLHRYTGARDLAVGVPVAGRHTAAMEPLIGFFVNTLVLRTQLRGHPTFKDWLQQVQATVADGLQHQDCPFADVVEALGGARVPGQNPLFPVMFQVQSGYQLQNAEKLAIDLPGLSLSQTWIELKHTKFDMSWHGIEREGALLMAVEYRTALFDGDRIQRMLSHFYTLVESVIAHPYRPLGELTLLSPPEQQQLRAWSPGPAVPAPDLCFAQRFEQQVVATPAAIALRTPQQTLTYQALNQRANQLAHWLQTEGIGPETLVGICLPAGIDLIIALLATLKAGGAYVPLDPTLPSARLQHMIQDAAPQVLLGCSDQISRWGAAYPSTTLLALDRDPQWLAGQPQENLPSRITPANLAYVIYTSGSTGKPKGTLITQGGLINYLNWCVTAYPLAQGQGVPVQSSIGFDATITSLFAPLLVGQTLLFGLGDSEIEAIQTAFTADVSLIKLTPAHLSALQPLLEMQALAAQHLPSALVIGGEALGEHHVRVLRSRYPQVSLINEYGPTEAVVGCCVHWVSPTDQDQLPIGRPIHGVQLYVLDEYLDPLPVGVPGELYIGGVGVARGYLHRPDLTAAQFIPNPFATAENPTCTLYKTGDQVCYRSDGTLDYWGRMDHQIKLRGFRIEPGEIEALLCRHPQVEQALVLRSESGQQSTLVAYTVSPISADAYVQLQTELRHRLTSALPVYMVPTHFIQLDTLPLTPHGKVDRQALPVPERAASTQEPSQPQTEKEEVLLAIWQEILDLDQLSIHDNFFDLGGDSITAMQIVAKAHQQGLQLTPSQLFHHQTIATQAAVAQQKMAVLDAGPIGRDAPLSPIQRDFFAQRLAVPHHYNQSLLVAVQPETSSEYLNQALQHLAQHHDALRLRFQPTAAPSASGWQQWYAAPETVTVPFEVVDLSHRAEALPETVATLQSSLDLTEGPLFRGAFLRLATGWRLLLIAHHLVVDGVSWRILLADLLDLYNQLDTHSSLTLPPKTTAFGDWTRHLQGQQFTATSPYWTAACRAVPTIPVDHPQGSNTVADQGEITLTLDSCQTALLKTFQLPVQSILLTALSQTLTQWSAHRTVTLDIEGHGRYALDEQLDLSRTVGWFTALYPLRLTLPPGALQEQVSYVHTQLAQVPHQGVGFGVLRASEPGRSPAAPQPLPLQSPAEVSFNYLGQLEVTPHGFIQGLAPEAVTALRSPENQCRYRMEVIALIRAGQLEVIWRYSQQCYQHRTLTQLSQRYLNNLKSLIAHCQEPRDYAPSDFTATQVDAQQLQQLMATLKAKGRV